MVFGAIMQSIGAGVQGLANLQASRFEAKLARRNRESLEFNRQDVLSRLEKGEIQLTRTMSNMIASERTRAAGGNVDVSFGSTALVQEDIRERAAEDITQLGENARLELMGIDTREAELRAQEKLARMRGRFAIVSGAVGAGSAAAGAFGGGKTSSGTALTSSPQAGAQATGGTSGGVGEGGGSTGVGAGGG
jgi:hypothetical protein